MKEEDINSWDPLKFYDKRIEELNILKEQAKSRTVKELISGAILKSEALLQKNLSIQKQTIAFIQSEKEKHVQSLLKIDEQIDLLNKELSKLPSIEGVSVTQRVEAMEYLNKVKAIGEKSRKNRVDVMKLQSTVMPNTALAFQNLLLDLIFKPSVATFHYDTIVDGLKFIGGLFIPAFDSLMTASNTPISTQMRKKQYLKSGDKILVYIEQYLDVMDKWEVLADEYIKLIKV